MSTAQFNKEFLKTLTILYVEDDESIRESLSAMLKKVFKEVITCYDGKDGLDNYLLYTNEINVEIDAIVSDIRMPNMDGLEMVDKIKKVNFDIPVIMTTAHGEANYMMEAIKIGVSGYILKPVDTKELILTIQKFCEIKKNQKLLVKKDEELSEYVNIINSIATLFKTDKDDNIIETNDLFLELMDYEKDELIGKNIIKLLHMNSIPKGYKQLKQDITDKKTYKGKILFLSKDEDIVPLRVTAIPSLNDNTNELEGYICVGFYAIDEELEQKQMKSRVRENMVGEKQKMLQMIKRIKELEHQLKKANKNIVFDEKSVLTLKEALENEKKKKNQLVESLKQYEFTNKQLKAKLDTFLNIKDDFKRREILADLQECNRQKSKLQDELLSARMEINKLKPKSKYVE